jgi:Flp pilus assembly protein TadB
VCTPLKVFISFTREGGGDRDCDDLQHELGQLLIRTSLWNLCVLIAPIATFVLFVLVLVAAGDSALAALPVVAVIAGIVAWRLWRARKGLVPLPDLLKESDQLKAELIRCSQALARFRSKT